MTQTLIWLFVVLVLAVAAIVIFAAFYQRATRETALVRTGVGGRKVIIDGGGIVIPWFQEVSRVNMQTLRLEVLRSEEDSLITGDRLRVDMGVEFYVSVIATEDGIARALQTLGNRTFQADKLRELIEGKLVDSLRSVAARMTLDDLHENRRQFADDVREALAESLARNGLELDTVSITALDQTPIGALDENNAFNAVGMRKLAEVIATSKKERAQIDADAGVSVRKAAMEASRSKLQIDLEEQKAMISQVQEIESLKAMQLAEVARKKATGEREAAEARIAMEQQIRSADIAREKDIRQAEIARDRELEEAAILLQRDVELAAQERQIAIAEKSKAENRALAAAEESKAASVLASEAVTTSRMVAEAERRKELARLAAEERAGAEASRLRLESEAAKEAAVNTAAAKDLETAANKKALLAKAEAQHAMNEAENALGDAVLANRVDLARIESMPKVVAEMVKPAEKIESIRINQVSGLGPVGATGAVESGERPAINQALESIMGMAVQLPALKKLGEEIGLTLGEEYKDLKS